ncbi:MAG TPA: sulfatase-like hydrolase/transferase [Gaiellaceae bacterium]|nr:sulfatase-like hydrolase/transferase [Gaiellaceae bacterium]
MPPLVVDAAHVAALSAFAIAQPIFNLLSNSAQFFAVRGSTSAEIVAFAVALVVAPFLIALVAEYLAGLAGKTPRLTLHLLFIAGLVALIAIRALKKGYDPQAEILAVGGLVFGLAGALCYWRFRAVRSMANLLVLAPAIFLTLFLFFSPVEKLVFPPEARASLVPENGKNDVVFIILDEFPTSSLMNGQGKIDAIRYPNFGDLARHSTWFRNATGEHEGTHLAVPAILDAKFPRPLKFPTFAYHPNNLFTLLGGHYWMNVWERQTHLCPPTLCRNNGELRGSFAGRMHSLFEDVGIVYLHMVFPTSQEDRLPDVATAWGQFRQINDKGFEKSRFRRFINSIPGPATRPTLSLVHVLLPHGTWSLLPSCHDYITPAYSPGLVLPGKRWGSNRWLVAQAFQRHLLQVECTDRLLGDLLRHLRAIGVYDRAMLIVTADQAVSIDANQSRRSVDPAHPTNFADIAFVPLFVKRPGQRTGAIVDRHVRTLDIVPTIADVLRISIPWHVDGRSLFGPGHSQRVDFLTARGWAHADVHTLERRRDHTLHRQLALFGAGNTPPGLLGLGPHPELRGRPVAELRVVRGAARASVDGNIADLLRSLPDGSDRVPAQVMGSIRGPGAAANRPLALAVNGRIAAVSKTYRQGSTVRYSAMAPESALHPGRNEVELFWIVQGRNGLVLESLGS